MLLYDTYHGSPTKSESAGWLQLDDPVATLERYEGVVIDMSDGGLLTVGEAAELVGVDPRRIYELIDAGQEDVPSSVELR